MNNSLLGPSNWSMLWVFPVSPLPGTHSPMFHLCNISNGQTQFCFLVSEPIVSSPLVMLAPANVTWVRLLIHSRDSPFCPHSTLILFTITVLAFSSHVWYFITFSISLPDCEDLPGWDHFVIVKLTPRPTRSPNKMWVLGAVTEWRHGFWSPLSRFWLSYSVEIISSNGRFLYLR